MAAWTVFGCSPPRGAACTPSPSLPPQPFPPQNPPQPPSGPELFLSADHHPQSHPRRFRTTRPRRVLSGLHYVSSRVCIQTLCAIIHRSRATASLYSFDRVLLLLSGSCYDTISEMDISPRCCLMSVAPTLVPFRFATRPREISHRRLALACSPAQPLGHFRYRSIIQGRRFHDKLYPSALMLVLPLRARGNLPPARSSLSAFVGFLSNTGTGTGML